MMTRIDGFETAGAIKASPLRRQAGGFHDRAASRVDKVRGLKVGAADYTRSRFYEEVLAAHPGALELRARQPLSCPRKTEKNRAAILQGHRGPRRACANSLDAGVGRPRRATWNSSLAIRPAEDKLMRAFCNDHDGVGLPQPVVAMAGQRVRHADDQAHRACRSNSCAPRRGAVPSGLVDLDENDHARRRRCCSRSAYARGSGNPLWVSRRARPARDRCNRRKRPRHREKASRGTSPPRSGGKTPPRRGAEAMKWGCRRGT